MAGVSPVRAAIAGHPTMPAVINGEGLTDLLTAASGVPALGLWLAVLITVCVLARWQYRTDHDIGMGVTFDPPDLPPEEAYENAIAFAEAKQPLAERLLEGGYYPSACNVYGAIVDAYETAGELAEAHGFDGREAYARLADARRAHTKARRRRQFWRFSVPGRPTKPRPGTSYADMLDSASATASWADKLFRDGHYETARSEYEIARDLYEEAVERAREHYMDPEGARTGLNTVEAQIRSCRERA